MKNIKSHFLSFILFFLVLVAGTLTGCKSTKSVPLTTTKEVTTNVETKEVIRDTIFLTKPDSSHYEGRLAIREGKITVSETVKKSSPGKYLSEPKVQIKDNILTVDCEARAQEIAAQLHDKFVREHKATIEKVPYPVKEPLTWWEVTQIWCGRLFLFALGVLLAQRFYKLKTRS